MSIHQTYLSCSSRGPVEACIFLNQLEIYDGCLHVWFAETFSSCSTEWLYVKSADLPDMFLQSSGSIVFQSDSKSINSTSFDWPRNIWIFSQKNYFIWSHQTCHKFAIDVLKKCCYFLEWIDGTLTSDCPKDFLLLTIKRCMLSHRTFKNFYGGIQIFSFFYWEDLNLGCIIT